MRQRRAVQARADCHAPLRQPVRQRLRRRVPRHHGQHRAAREHLIPPGLLHPPGQLRQKRPLIGRDLPRREARGKAQPRQKPRRAVDILSPRLQPVRQKVRHLLQLGETACAAAQQRLRHLPRAAQQQPRALGAIQPLVARHGHIGRAPFTQAHRQDSGGLGGIHHQRHAPAAADPGDVLHRQLIAKHVGDMGADHRRHRAVHRRFKALRHLLRGEQPPVDDAHRHIPDGVEGPGHRIVLIAGDHHRISRLHQAPDGQIQAMGGAAGEDHLLRSRRVKVSGRLAAQLQHHLGGPPGRRIVPPPRRGHRADSLRHRPRHRCRFLQRGGGTVEIDHIAPPVPVLVPRSAAAGPLRRERGRRCRLPLPIRRRTPQAVGTSR